VLNSVVSGALQPPIHLFLIRGLRSEQLSVKVLPHGNIDI